MRQAILGMGGVGGLIGAALGSLGESVIAIVRPEALAMYPETITAERASGTLTARIKKVGKLTDPADVLWIATKTYQLQTALPQVEVLPNLVIPLLNGVDHIAVLRSRYGHDQVVPATIAVEAERLAPGRFIQRSPMVRLSVASSGEPVLGSVIGRLGEIAFTCQFVQNEQTLLWSKLCFLAPFALVTSASGKDKGGILADPEWKGKLDLAISEACAVAKASGGEVDHAKIEALIASFPPVARSSMAKDVIAKRKLELDEIAGPILRGGQRYGIDVSTTASLVAAVKAIAGSSA